MSKEAPKTTKALDEEAMIKLWAQEGLFEKSIENRKGGPRFRFYDGPPFTSGTPHYGHVEQSTIKDSVARYKTMQGYYVPRRTGCDTHGLPIENLVEKEHSFSDKQDIIKFGIDNFNKACREIVFRHKKDFDNLYERLGRWNDPDNVYATLDDDYMESVWWVFKTIYDKGLVYKGFKSMPYCPRCATPLSNFEVNDGYKDDVEDPSVYVKFKLKDHNEYMLAWTTTPWSLPGNAALAVNPSANYVKVSVKNDEEKTEVLVLAEDRLEVLDADTHEVLGSGRGRTEDGEEDQF
jgi:isoleucyl-tRNA synthetase